MATKWKKIESKAWKPEKEGDQITGVLIGKEPKTEDLGARYTVENKEGAFLVWGSAVLDDRMQQVPVGSQVRITFEGQKDLGKGKKLNQYEVEIAESENATSADSDDKDAVPVEDIEDAK